jgi:hypothetical protein
MSKSISRAQNAAFNLLPGSCNAGGTTLDWFVHPPIGEEDPDGVIGGVDVDGIKTDEEPRESGLIELMSKVEPLAE